MQVSTFESLRTLSNKQLVGRVKYLAQKERHTSAELIGHLAVFDERQLYAAEACSSLFSYCTQVLRLSEHSAYGRIEAARAARRFPIILGKLSKGALNLTGITLLAPHLTQDNHRALLEEAEGKSRRKIEEIVARLHPSPDFPSSIRKLPERRAGSVVAVRGDEPLDPTEEENLTPDVVPEHLLGSMGHGQMENRDEGGNEQPTPGEEATATMKNGLVGIGSAQSARQGLEAALYRRAIISPSAPGRYSFRFTAGSEMHEKVRMLQDLLSVQVPDRDIVKIFDLAITTLLEKLLRRKHAVGLDKETPRAPHEEHAPAGPTDGTLDAGMQDTNVIPPIEPEIATALTMSSTVPSTTDRWLRRSRHIPARVRRAIWKRDGGQCTYKNPEGRRCSARSRLQYHHLIPFAEGGPSTIENLTLRCRTHNAYDARLYLIEKEWMLIREAIGKDLVGTRRPAVEIGRSEHRTSGLCSAHAP